MYVRGARLSRPDPAAGRAHDGVTTLARHRGAGYVTSGGQDRKRTRGVARQTETEDRKRGSVSRDKDGIAKGLLKITGRDTREERRWMV